MYKLSRIPPNSAFRSKTYPKIIKFSQIFSLFNFLLAITRNPNFITLKNYLLKKFSNFLNNLNFKPAFLSFSC